MDEKLGPEFLAVRASAQYQRPLEDRRVKRAFRDDERLEVLTGKPVRADEQEIIRNPRARSAKLRVAGRV